MLSTEKEYRDVLAFFVSLPAEDRLNLLHVTKPRSAAVLHRMYDVLSQTWNQPSIAFYFDGIQQWRTIKNYGEWTPSMEPSLEKLKFLSTTISSANFELEFELERLLRFNLVDDMFVPFEFLELNQDARKIFDMLFKLAPFVASYDRMHSKWSSTQYFTPLTFVASLMMKNIVDRYRAISKKGIKQPARCSTMSDGPNVRHILARLRQFSRAEMLDMDLSFAKELVRRYGQSVSGLPIRSNEQDEESLEALEKVHTRANGWEKVNSWAKQWGALDPRLERSQISAAATPLGVASPVEDEPEKLVSDYLGLVLSSEKLQHGRSLFRREIFSSFKRGPHVETFGALADLWHGDQELCDVSCMAKSGARLECRILMPGCNYAETMMQALLSFPMAYSAMHHRCLHKETQFMFAETAQDVIRSTRSQQPQQMPPKVLSNVSRSMLSETPSRLGRVERMPFVRKDTDRENQPGMWGGTATNMFANEVASAGGHSILFEYQWSYTDKLNEVMARSDVCLGQTAQQMDEASLAYENMSKKSFNCQPEASVSPLRAEQVQYNIVKSSRQMPTTDCEKDVSDSSLESKSNLSYSSLSSDEESGNESLNSQGQNGPEDGQSKQQNTSILVVDTELHAPSRDKKPTPPSTGTVNLMKPGTLEEGNRGENSVGESNVNSTNQDERDKFTSLKSDISAAKAAENASGIMFSASNDLNGASALDHSSPDVQELSRMQYDTGCKGPDKPHKAGSKRLSHYNPLRPEHHSFTSMPDDRKSVTRRLHSEIVELLNQVYPTNTTRSRRQRIVDLVDEAVKSCWEGAHVEVYGSFSTDLYLPHSDVDVLVIGAGERSIESNMKHLAARLKSMPWCRYMRSIENTSVPVIKLSADVSKISLNEGPGGSAADNHDDSDTNSDNSRAGNHLRGYSPHDNISVDITFHGCSRMRSPVAFRDFVRKELARYEIIKPLGFVFKYFLYKLGLNDAYTGGLSSHSAILLLIFYFNLDEVSKAYADSKVPGSPQEIPEDCKYGEWLLRFFQWVAEFPYKHVGISFGIGEEGVCPYFISVSNFGHGLIKLRQYDPSLPEVPEESKGAFDRLFIGDPTDVSINVANSSFQWFLVQLSIQGAFKVLSDHVDTAPHLRIYGGVSESPSPLQNIFNPAVVQAAGKLRMAAKCAPR